MADQTPSDVTVYLPFPVLLDVPCMTCNQAAQRSDIAGYLATGPLAAYIKKHKKLPGPKGTYPFGDANLKKCTACDGNGFDLTDYGEALLQFREGWADR